MPFEFERDTQSIFYRCVEDSSEAIMITNAKGGLVYVNPAWIRIYGYSWEEAVGQNPRILHSGHHSQEFYKQMWAQISQAEGGHWKGEVINRAKSGQLIPVFLSITPFKIPGGDRVGHLGIALDLSGKKELEAKIVHQDRLATIGLLASGLAHEVGTPLGVIRGRAELLMMQAKEGPLSKGLEVIISQIDRISKLIHSLLRVSRSSSDLQMADVNLRAVINEVLALVGQNLQAEAVEIRVEIPEALKARADFNRLEQITLNLVMNSIHAIRKAIEGGRAAPHRLILSAEERGKKVALQIKDSGCGIAAENMKLLFKPFYTTKDVGEGTGLGLAIVSQLVHEMGGEISVVSTVNLETTFSIILNRI